jgi:hypothetical protein
MNSLEIYLYAWHLFYCWQERQRGELSEAMSLEEFRLYH